MLRPLAVAAAALLALPLFASDIKAQVRQPAPLPQGARITAQNGDTILLEGDAQIRILRRRDANVRVVFNRTERWLLLLADYASNGGPDGRVDWSYSYREVSGEWPMADRWEGPTTLEEYGLAPNGPGVRGLSFTGPAGTIHILSGPSQVNDFDDPKAAAVLTSRGSSAGRRAAESFDAAEATEIANIRRNAGGGAQFRTLSTGGAATFQTEVSIDRAPEPIDSVAPARIGGGVPAPQKMVDVPPVLPDAAARAGVRGVVILEITVAPDGTVRNPRVLRSIPLLDAAALDAVRQWRYSPPMVNGTPVPVVMTVSIPFQ